MSAFYDLASLVLVPSGYKASKVYAQKPLTTDGQLAFSRASTATRVGPDGLIEKVRTNLALYSQDFTNGTWVKSGGVTLTAGQTDPNGGTTASRIVFATGSDEINQTVSTSAGVNTISIYIKGTAGETISLNDSTSSTLVTLTASFVRYTLTSTHSGSGSWLKVTPAAGTARDIVIAFAQSETGDIATDYIATTSAAVSVGPVANVPRLDYLGSSCPRLLLEPQRTNLVFYSEQLNNAGWAGSAVVTANTAVSPDGFTNADSVMDSATTDYQIIGDPVATTNGTAYTFSFFAKPNGRNFARVLFGNGSFPDNQSAYFNLLTGATSASAYATASMVSYGNGWYRCIATCTSDANATDSVYFGPARNMTDGYLPYVGNVSLGIYAWGAQLEAGAYATSYIPTLGAAVTRGVDTASKTGISSLIGQTEGTLFVDFIQKAVGAAVVQIQLNDGSNSNRVQLEVNSSGVGVMYVFSGAGLTGQINLGTFTTGTRYKVAMAYKVNDFVTYINGASAGTDTSGAVPVSMSRIDLGAEVGTPYTGYELNQALLFKTRLTNADLAALTA
jgi:hypothetical protein